MEAEYHKNQVVKHRYPLRRPASARPEGAILSPEHVRELEASAIAPEVRDARGYWTATSRSQLVGLFPKWQRRAPALVVPMFAPDGVSTRAQVKPKTPRKRNGKTVKYETAHGGDLILDVHPFMLEALGDPHEPLLITEGVKTGDAATSRGRCTIVLAGVDCWQSGGVPLPCWGHVPLEGRRVFVCFDADVMTKPEVQRALAKLVAFLEDRGAIVRVIYLPRPGGLDDNLAAGEKLAELEMAARPFDAEALAAERLERDSALRLALEERRRYLDALPVRTTGEGTRAAVVRALTAAAERSGELVGDGVRVIMDRRTLAEKAQKSKKAVNRAIAHLEARETPTLRVDNAGRRAEKAGAFVLLTPVAQKGTHNGERGALGGRPGKGGEGFSDLFMSPSDRGGHPSALEAVPALRWSKVILYWAREDGVYKVVDHHYVPRLGEKRGAIIRHVLEAGGAATLEDLMQRFASARTRPWDFRRRVLGPILEAGILSATAEGVALASDWREVLERERVEAGEIEDAERQRERHSRQRQGFRRRHEHRADPTPGLKGAERVGEMLDSRRPEWERRRVEAEREKVGTTAAVFVADELEGATAVRWREMRERWRARGGRGEDLTRAVNVGPFRFDREADGWLYVYPAEAPPPRRGEASVIPLRKVSEAESFNRRAKTGAASVNAAAKKRAPEAESVNAVQKTGPRLEAGISHHGPLCGCEWCNGPPPAPRYATAWSAS